MNGAWLDPETGATLEADALLTAMARKQVVLLGETHDIAEIHLWQADVIAGLHARRADIVVGFEMFPTRLQSVLDRWVAGALSVDAFLEETEWRRVWGFPAELYLPIFHLCRDLGLPMLALNCERALVSRVGGEGWAAIPEAEREGLTPAAPATPEYRRYLFGMVGRGGARSADPQDATWDRFVRAQQCWDRAFACNIRRALDGASPLVVGIIGRGHLEYGFGTPGQLRDLGVKDVAVLLPLMGAPDPRRIRGIGDAIFRLEATGPRAPGLDGGGSCG
ncbi:MAG: ChaN family lipoprotein [Pikeienuella sp.]